MNIATVLCAVSTMPTFTGMPELAMLVPERWRMPCVPTCVTLAAWRVRFQPPIGFLTHGLGHAAGLAFRPDDAPVLQVDPLPFEQHDFGAAGRELELQPDCQRDDIGLDTPGLHLDELLEQLAHFLVGNQAGCLAGEIHRDVTTQVRAIRPVALQFGHVEHLAHDAEHMVRLCRLVLQIHHHRRDIRALHVLHLLYGRGLG